MKLNNAFNYQCNRDIVYTYDYQYMPYIQMETMVISEALPRPETMATVTSLRQLGQENVMINTKWFSVY